MTRELEHCQIVRMDLELKDRVEAYRLTLERVKGRRVSWAEAVRELCRRALPRKGRRRAADTGQMQLFGGNREKVGA